MGGREYSSTGWARIFYRRERRGTTNPESFRGWSTLMDTNEHQSAGTALELGAGQAKRTGGIAVSTLFSPVH